jgi:hypothetical protein
MASLRRHRAGAGDDRGERLGDENGEVRTEREENGFYGVGLA